MALTRRTLLGGLGAVVAAPSWPGEAPLLRSGPAGAWGRRRWSAAASDAEPEPVALGLAVHTAHEAGKPVADGAFWERQLGTANRIFAPYGVSFAVREEHRRAEQYARMETRGDRHALGAFVRPHWINVFVVASLRDVDDPKRMRRGVHWRSVPHAPAHFVILSAISFDAVLAHELGHFLGNPRHSQTPGNLMSYQHTEVLPFLDEAQQRRVHRAIARYLKTGELRQLTETPSS